MTDHDGFGSPARAARARVTLDSALSGGVEVSTSAFRRSQRLTLAARVVVFAVGFAMAVGIGAGWAALSIAVVTHHLLYRSRQVLVATDDGLAVTTSGPRSCRVDERWNVGAQATFSLTEGQPDVELTIGTWTGRLHGIDFRHAEHVIRMGGGEPVRTIRQRGG